MSENTISSFADQFADPRTAKVIEDGWFFEPFQTELVELFYALDRREQFREDPRQMMSYVVPGWIGEEHGNNESKDQFTDAQVRAAMPIIESMGLTQGIKPPPGIHVKRAVALGATYPSTIVRSEVINDAITNDGVTVDQVDIWVGQRSRQERDGTNSRILAASGHDISANPWVRHTQNQGVWDEANAWGLTEEKFGRLAALKVWGGGLLTHRINLGVTDLQHPHHKTVPRILPGVPANIPESYEYETPDGQRIVVINNPAVVRDYGPPRHTTESSAENWLEYHAPPQDANVLFVSHNPHTVRTAMKVKHVLNQHGRRDIRLTVAGAPADPGATIQLFLGEVGAMLAFDVQQNYS